MARTKQTARKCTGGKAPVKNQFARSAHQPIKVPPQPPAAAPAKPKKKATAGIKALKEIRELQKNTGPLVPFAPVARTVRDIMMDVQDGESNVTRLTRGAVEVLREAMEAYLVSLFEDANLAAIHGKRVTIMPKDLALTRFIRKEVDTLTPSARAAMYKAPSKDKR